MPLVEENIEVKGESIAIFDIIKDFESYPSYMENVKKVETLSRDGSSSTTKWFTEVDGRNIVWTEKDELREAEHRIDFTQVEGDLKLFYGFWKLDPSAADPSNQTITFSIYFEFGIPMLAALLHPLLSKKLRQNMRQMLEGIKNRVEGSENRTQVRN